MIVRKPQAGAMSDSEVPGRNGNHSSDPNEPFGFGPGDLNRDSWRWTGRGVAAPYIVKVTPLGVRLAAIESSAPPCPVIRKECSASSSSRCVFCFSFRLVSSI